MEGSTKQGAQDIIGIPLGVLPKSEQYRHGSPLQSKHKWRLFCVNSHHIINLSSVDHSLLLLSFSHCLRLLFSDDGKPATECEIKFQFRSANIFERTFQSKKKTLAL